MMDFMKGRSGELSLGALFVSGLSGFILAYQYDPGQPFVSTIYIETLLPFGSFFRSLHFWSSQAFFLLLLWHVYCSYGKSADLKRRRLGDTGPAFDLKWLVLSTTIFLALYALFSGYCLRYDRTGRDAAQIAEHLFLSIPLAGELVDRLLLSLRHDGLNRVYAVHILFTFILWLMGTWYHLKRTILRSDVLLGSLLAGCLLALLLKAPLDPKDMSLDMVKGPWFFLGVQELLRHAPPFQAGILFPLVPLMAIAGMSHAKIRKKCLIILGSWTILYFLLTITLILR